MAHAETRTGVAVEFDRDRIPCRVVIRSELVAAGDRLEGPELKLGYAAALALIRQLQRATAEWERYLDEQPAAQMVVGFAHDGAEPRVDIRV